MAAGEWCASSTEEDAPADCAIAAPRPYEDARGWNGANGAHLDGRTDRT